MRLIDRIFEYLHHHRITAYNFERELGIANGYLKKQHKGKGTIGSEILEKISEKYKDLNISWLITGKGKMLADPNYKSLTEASTMYEPLSGYGQPEQAIRLLREKIVILENALADKEKIIRLLEQNHQNISSQ